MTSLLVFFWLAAAPGEATATNASATAPTAPQAPTPPAAPAVNGPPLPAPPEFPSAQRGSTPASGSKSAKKGAEDDEADDALGEATAGKQGSERSGSRKRSSSAGSQGRGVPSLPTLSTNALRSELRQSLSGSSESAQVSERARLEQLTAEIAKAREALRQETARLEELIRQRGSCDGELRAAAASGSKTAADSAAAKDAEREQMENVSKTMKGMKPEQAAAVVTRLDHRLASEILRRMRPADAGAVLGFLRPELAAELATEIATRRSTIPAKKGAGTP